ncbi:oligosaccharide flippase family protein [Novosphingobium profundi]|uniref:oligosaccharide flippase family protein n=1 Tax=Novosphingobium profundi TaxID=1774954 RepID=UPI001BDAD7B6|nr:oligosaccharide flippase family protein [Novosphingobium profundi]
MPPSNHFAGMERVVHDLALGLSSHYADQFDVTVLYCRRYPELPEDLPYSVIWEEVDQLRGFPLRVARRLGRRNFDLVVIAQFEPTALVWLCHRLMGGKARFIMHFHGNPRIEGGGSRRARLAFSLFNRIVPRMDKVIAVSPSLARYVDGRTGRPGLTDYLPNPVRQFAEVERAVPREGPVHFVTIGRLAWQKGHDVLVAAFARLVARGIDARLTIVGDGDEYAALAQQIETLGLAGKVHLAGSVAYPAQHLAEADCFVSGSRWEGFGVAIVEGLSAGLCVIATDCEFGPSDLIDTPQKGWIVPVEDAEALAEAMAAFVQNERALEDEAVRRAAAAFFRLDNVVAQHAAMLGSMAQGGAPAHSEADDAPSEAPVSGDVACSAVPPPPEAPANGALGGRTAGSAVWLMGGRLFTKAVEFLTLLALAQLLTPADFGVVAIAMTLVTIIEAVFELPIYQVLIARNEIERRHLDTAFTLGLLRGLALTLVVWALALPFAHFYKSENLAWMILALGLAPGLRGMGSPRLVVYARNLNYRREIAAEMICKTGSLVLSVLGAWAFRDYRALMIGILATPSIWIVATYLLAPYRPRFSLAQWSSFRGFLGWTTAAQLIAAINWQCDRLILGRFVAPAQLGTYSVANDLSYVPELALIRPILRPLLSVFSQISGQRARLASAYLMASNAVLALGAPVLLGLSVLAGPAVELALGDKWLAAIPILQWLSLTLIPPLFTAPYASLAMATDRPQGLLGERAAELLFKLPLMVVGAIGFGVEGAVGARAIASVTTALIVMVLTSRMIGVSLLGQVAGLWRTILASGALVLVLAALRPLLDGMTGLALAAHLVIVAGLGMGAYVMVLALAWHHAGRPGGIEHMLYDRLVLPALERLARARVRSRSAR